MLRFRRLPFYTPRELNLAIYAHVTRTPTGCLLFESPSGDSWRVCLRGVLQSVARVVWSEAYAHSHVMQAQLETHEVLHIAECPHTGAVGVCIEPTHLRLGTQDERRSLMRERTAGYGGCHARNQSSV